MKRIRNEQLSLEQEFLKSLKSLSKLNKKAEDSLEVQLEKWKDALSAIENSLEYIPKMDGIVETFSKAASYFVSGYEDYGGSPEDLPEAMEKALQIGKNLPGVFSSGRVNIDIMEKYAEAFSEIKKLTPQQQQAALKKLGILKLANATSSATEVAMEAGGKLAGRQLTSLPFIGWAFNLFFGFYYFYYGLKDFFSILSSINKTGIPTASVLNGKELERYFEENKESPEKVKEIGILAQCVSSFISDVLGTLFNVGDFIINIIFLVLQTGSLFGWVIPFVGQIPTAVLTAADFGQSALVVFIQYVVERDAAKDYEELIVKIKAHISAMIDTIEANLRYRAAPSPSQPNIQPDSEREGGGIPSPLPEEPPEDIF